MSGSCFAAGMRALAIAIGLLLLNTARAQVLTKADSLNAGLVPSDRTTLVSAYGELKVTYDQHLGTGKANLTRNVLFLGHRFNSRISFLSEMELENARVEGGAAGGELSMEQIFVKFDLTKDIYLTGGLFITRLGIINENHLPTTFNGNDRPFVEQFIIPSTWRRIGIGLHGRSTLFQGLNWSVAVQNGLDARALEHGTGIREGRGDGAKASAANIGLSGSLLYYTGDFRLQARGYFGGSAGLTQRGADSLQLDHRASVTPVRLLEANAQYFGEKLRVKVLAT